MQKITEEKRQDIIKILREKGVHKPCPRCNHESFSLADGYFNQIIQQEIKKIDVIGPALPSIVLICTNCGYISQHALGALGLMPTQEEKNETLQ